MRLARVNKSTGVVENIIMPYGPPEEYLDIQVSDNDSVKIGYLYQDNQFLAPDQNFANPEEE